MNTVLEQHPVPWEATYIHGGEFQSCIVDASGVLVARLNDGKVAELIVDTVNRVHRVYRVFDHATSPPITVCFSESMRAATERHQNPGLAAPEWMDIAIGIGEETIRGKARPIIFHPSGGVDIDVYTESGDRFILKVKDSPPSMTLIKQDYRREYADGSFNAFAE